VSDSAVRREGSGVLLSTNGLMLRSSGYHQMSALSAIISGDSNVVDIKFYAPNPWVNHLLALGIVRDDGSSELDFIPLARSADAVISAEVQGQLQIVKPETVKAWYLPSHHWPLDKLAGDTLLEAVTTSALKARSEEKNSKIWREFLRTQGSAMPQRVREVLTSVLL
jgi:hypothetical protein